MTLQFRHQVTAQPIFPPMPPPTPPKAPSVSVPPKTDDAAPAKKDDAAPAKKDDAAPAKKTATASAVPTIARQRETPPKSKVVVGPEEPPELYTKSKKKKRCLVSINLFLLQWFGGMIKYSKFAQSTKEGGQGA